MHSALSLAFVRKFLLNANPRNGPGVWSGGRTFRGVDATQHGSSYLPKRLSGLLESFFLDIPHEPLRISRGSSTYTVQSSQDIFEYISAVPHEIRKLDRMIDLENDPTPTGPHPHGAVGRAAEMSLPMVLYISYQFLGHRQVVVSIVGCRKRDIPTVSPQHYSV